MTPVHAAAENNADPKLMEMLLEKGGDLHKIDMVSGRVFPKIGHQPLTSI